MRMTVAAGAVGVNLEDLWRDASGGRLVDPAYQVEVIRAAREAGAAAGVPVVINARTDVYMVPDKNPAGRLEHAVRRANTYHEAGADCLFIPGVRDRETIARLVREIDGPVNILAGPGAPPIPELEHLGVARVSVGSGPMAATLGLVQRNARELRDSGTYTFADGAVPHAELNKLFAGHAAGE